MTATSGGTSGLDIAPGRVVGERYEVDRLIGRGGMSSVFAAVDTQLGRSVALKVFRTELAAGDGMRRHRDEIDLLASLNHPALVTLFDAVDDVPTDGGAALVLELVDGDDLGRLISLGRVPYDQVAVIGATIAEGLAHIHDRGIIHRDVKPGNILVPSSAEDETTPRAKLVDFGIARLVDSEGVTGTGAVLGTVHYLSPEQALGAAIGPPSDIYSLGLVLLEALTGHRAFEGSGVAAAAARVSRDIALPTDLHVAWASVLGRMVAREPDERPTAREVAQELRALADVPALDVDDAATAALAPSGADDEAQPPTRVLPPIADRTTDIVPPVSPGEPDETGASSGSGDSGEPAATTTAPDEPARSRRRTRAIVIVLLVIVALVAAIAIVLGGSGGGGGPAPVDYPDVPGELGDHLERLQRSVTP
ncbi:serine/threonine-protein kinase [Microcella sp.]|uniref:serine/threonine-protein kinase n=1 Tax=Microcella sp. TaxID=1913979 RepID=UPI00391A1299